MQKFYFDEISTTLPHNTDGTIRYDTAPKYMIFTMTKFDTNKSLKNIFGSHLNDLKERVNMFLNNKKWFYDKGVPYTLGIMLHGPPGTGKTSIIKSIAKDTKRHVFNIKLNKYSTQTQLRNLFFNEKVDIIQDGRTESFNIPINERLYVIEDIDCLTDVVNKRKEEKIGDELITNPSNNFKPMLDVDSNTQFNSETISFSTFDNIQMNNGNKQDKIQSEGLNLSFILNLLDGILETPGRIIIVTSNHPDKLDPAFIRPGRIDINLKVGYCDKEMIKTMFSYFYDKDCDYLFDDYKEKQITPAELNKIIMNNYNDVHKAYKCLTS